VSPASEFPHFSCGTHPCRGSYPAGARGPRWAPPQAPPHAGTRPGGGGAGGRANVSVCDRGGGVEEGGINVLHALRPHSIMYIENPNYIHFV
jgi:hypothetical protein